MKYKGWITALLCINALLTIILIFASFQAQPTESKAPPEPEPLTEISNDLLISNLLHYVDLVVAGYYKETSAYGVSISPYMMEIISLKRLGNGKSYEFEVTLKVTPYTGAHIPLGEDLLTFEIRNGFVQLTDFKHQKDFPAVDFQYPQ